MVKSQIADRHCRGAACCAPACLGLKITAHFFRTNPRRTKTQATHTVILALAILLLALSHTQTTHAQTPPAQTTYPQSQTPQPSPTKCAWLNQATARGALGGPVTLTVTINEKNEGRCDYSHQHGSFTSHLRITVNLMTDIPKQFPTYSAQCPPKSEPLSAIGNEATICTIQSHQGEQTEKVVGRVRDQAFVVTITSNPDDPAMPQQTRREKVSLIAEQVAGILF